MSDIIYIIILCRHGCQISDFDGSSADICAELLIFYISTDRV